jgi:hypothetical protein
VHRFGPVQLFTNTRPYVCMHACMCIHIVPLSARMNCAYMHLKKERKTYKNTYIHTYACTPSVSCRLGCTLKNTQLKTHTTIHIFIHTCMHACMHTGRLSQIWLYPDHQHLLRTHIQAQQQRLDPRSYTPMCVHAHLPAPWPENLCVYVCVCVCLCMGICTKATQSPSFGHSYMHHAHLPAPWPENLCVCLFVCFVFMYGYMHQSHTFPVFWALLYASRPPSSILT